MAVNPIPPNNLNQQGLDLFKKVKPINPMQGNVPYVGVVDVPELSKMPIQDTLKKHEAETRINEPAPKQKKKKMDKSIKLDILAVLACAIGLCFAFFKKTKKG